MEIIRVETRKTESGRADYFTGHVLLDPIASPPLPSRVRALRVTFAPGARTAWHTHPFGQVLHILAGIGAVQRAGEPIQTVKPGDTVVIGPGERHWHGADPTHLMVHLAIQEADDAGVQTTWFEHVTDAEYGVR
ncbi:MAG: cupin domain-containing protein [Opitutaceae bacterium]|nr:cupin domain-containing protein [Opitutaceae bacterium]